jgi:hypothetical protein
MIDKQQVDPVAVAKTTMIVVIVLVIIGGICAIVGALVAGLDYDREIQAIRGGNSSSFPYNPP